MPSSSSEVHLKEKRRKSEKKLESAFVVRLEFSSKKGNETSPSPVDFDFGFDVGTAFSFFFLVGRDVSGSEVEIETRRRESEKSSC